MIALFAGASVANSCVKFFRWVYVKMVIAIVEPVEGKEGKEGKD